MSRLLVDGYVKFPNGGMFADTNPVAMQPSVPAGQQSYPDVEDARAIGTVTGQIVNSDSVAHNFRGFLRGTGIPGGEVELGAPTAPSPYLINGLAAGLDAFLILYFLMPGQRFDLEMVEAVTTTPPAFQMQLVNELIQALTVKGRVPGNQIDLVNDTTPSVVQGPPAGARLRRVCFAPFGASLGCQQSFFYNRDYAVGGDLGTKTITFTLIDPVNGNREIDAVTVLSNNKTAFPDSTIDLEAGQSLQLSVAEATHVTDPVMFWYFEDVL